VLAVCSLKKLTDFLRCKYVIECVQKVLAFYDIERHDCMIFVGKCMLYRVSQLVNMHCAAILLQFCAVLRKQHHNRRPSVDETELTACPYVRGLLAALLHCCERCISGGRTQQFANRMGNL
jgi:hypothetical protein